MEKHAQIAGDAGTAPQADQNTSDDVLSNLILGGAISAGIGSVLAAVVMATRMMLDGPAGGLSAIGILLPMVFGLLIPGLFLILLIAITLILPMRHFFKRTLSIKWMTVLSAVWGAILAGSPFAIQLALKYSSNEVVYYGKNTQDNMWTIPLVWCGCGFMFGGLFGFWFKFLEKYNRPKLKSKPLVPGPVTVPKSKGISVSWVAWPLSICVIAVVFGMFWVASTPDRMIATAKREALANQEAILAEAQDMLDEAKMAAMGYVSYGFSGKKPLPENFAKMGDNEAMTSVYFPGAVKVSVTGGFTHFGLFIVPNPTSATLSILSEEVISEDHGSLTVVNDHIYQYSE